MRRDNGAVSSVPFTKCLPLSRQCAAASGIGRDRSEQFHEETVQPGERGAIRFVRTTLHRPGKPRADRWVPCGRLYTRHYVVEHVAPLAERQEVVETFEDDILAAEVLS